MQTLYNMVYLYCLSDANSFFEMSLMNIEFNLS